jgi:hypothetical protein
MNYLFDAPNFSDFDELILFIENPLIPSRQQMHEKSTKFIKCKSTKKIITTFCSKIFIILQFVEDNSLSLSDFGCAWIDKDKGEFQVQIDQLAKSLKIKVNSLSRNFRDDENIKFRDRFKEKSSNKIIHVFQYSSFKLKQIPFVILVEDLVDKFQQISETDKEKIKKEVVDLGQMLFSTNTDELALNFNKFVKALIHPMQSFENGEKVINHWINKSKEDEITIEEFVKFESMFGPFNSSMEKIYSLTSAMSKFHFTLDIRDIDQNCFKIHIQSDKFIKIWNNPCKRFGEQFILDEQGNGYECWETFLKFQNVSQLS